MGTYRLRAPERDGEAVSRPSLAEACEALRRNRERLEGWDHDFQGRRSSRLRREARAQLLRLSREFHRRHDLEPDDGNDDPEAPLVVTGHQPELFHPGVWAKNFAAAWIARQVGGKVLNLVVDNDLPRGAHVRVPTLQGGRLMTALVDYDLRAEEVPYEEWSVHDEHYFDSFPERLRSVLHPAIEDPLVDEFWPIARQNAGITDRIGLRFVAARHGVEASWGVSGAELPLSLACETDAFLWFVSHILAQLPRFQAIHNESLGRYRRQYRIRSRHHPVADLHADGPWREAPFWVWRRRSGPRRRALLARQNARTLDLRIDGEDSLLATLPLSPDAEACCAVERLRELPVEGVRLRPRALTTTMFARLLVGDLFLHGIGGAKYDELGDQIVEAFYAIEPPRFLAFSMTLWPGLPLDPATPERRRDVRRQLRALEYNPDRFLDPPLPDRLRRAVDAKRSAVEGPTSTRRERVGRYDAIRGANAVLREAVEPRAVPLRRELERLREGLEHNRIAQGRDYPLVVHSRSMLLERFGSAFPGLLGG